MQSTADRDPFFGPHLPTYPALNSLCRVTGPAQGGVYPAFAVQFVPATLAARDREPVYVYEPNGIALGPGYYDCRLVDSYNGLPLYVTTCCVVAGSASSSSSRSSSSAPASRVLVAGYGVGGDALQQFALVRYTASGVRDATFGTGGLVLTSFGIGTSSVAEALAVQADGKYVLAGVSAGEFALARYKADGTLDTTFGSGGLVTTSFAGFTGSRAQGVAVQGDGKIVAAGFATGAGTAVFALARYNADGTLDSSFGTGGKVTTDFGEAAPNDQANAVLVQGDGKIVAVGLSSANPAAPSFGLARYNADGTLDTAGFGTGGKVSTDFGGAGATAYAAALQSDGKVVAAGAVSDGLGGFLFGLARYTTAGALDTGFNTTGTVTTSLSGGDDEAHGLAIQSDGKPVAVGLWDTTGYAAVRYTTAGALDSSFGSGGKVQTTFGTSGDFLQGVAVQSDGKVVGVGTAANQTDFGLVRYSGAGALDSGFGTAGLVNDNLAGSGGQASAVILVT